MIFMPLVIFFGWFNMTSEYLGLATGTVLSFKETVFIALLKSEISQLSQGTAGLLFTCAW